MGVPLSVVVPSVVQAIIIYVEWLNCNPERENPTFDEVEHRVSQPGRIAEMGEKGQDSKMQVDSGEAIPPSKTSSLTLGPTVWPTREEFDDAKERFEYTPNKLRFAITGIAGSGKSSLVNSFRGLRPGEDGAAKTGANEATINVKRHPHPDTESPLARIEWYDVPGAGTQTTPGGSSYFNSQGLFIFDFIILVPGDRFTEQDLDILANCKMYNIPSCIVRSKADTHIGNTMRDENCSQEGARRRYIAETNQKFKVELEKASGKVSLDSNTEIFLVSSEPLRDFIKSFMDGKAPESAEAMIDEEYLVRKILLTAQMRRYPSKFGVGWALKKARTLRYVSLNLEEKN